MFEVVPTAFQVVPTALFISSMVHPQTRCCNFATKWDFKGYKRPLLVHDVIRFTNTNEYNLAEWLFNKEKAKLYSAQN